MNATSRILRYACRTFAAALLFSISACSDDMPNITGNESQQDSEKRKITITAEDYTADLQYGTRGLTALTDELQKQIHNLFFFFYNPENNIENIYYMEMSSPTMKIQLSLDDFTKGHNGEPIKADGQLFVVANSWSMHTANVTDDMKDRPLLVSSEREDIHLGDINAWKQKVPTVALFQKESLYPVFFPNTEGKSGGVKQHGKPDHVIMFGYFDGTIEKTNIQIPLGRIVSRLRINLSGDGLGPQARITIKNAPCYSAIFPVAITPMANDTTATDPIYGGQPYWYNYEEMIDNGTSDDNQRSSSNMYIGVGNDLLRGGITGSKGSYESSAIYYCGENNNYYTGIKTYVQIETWDQWNGVDGPKKATAATDFQVERGKYKDGTTDQPDRVYETVLGHDSPEMLTEAPDAERDVSIYRNTSYTFNLKLHKTKTSPAKKARKNAEFADGEYSLYPL